MRFSFKHSSRVEPRLGARRFDTSQIRILLCRVNLSHVFQKLYLRKSIQHQHLQLPSIFCVPQHTHCVSHPQQGQIPHWIANNCCTSKTHPLMCCDGSSYARFNKHQCMNKIPIFTQNRQSERKTALMTIA